MDEPKTKNKVEIRTIVTIGDSERSYEMDVNNLGDFKDSLNSMSEMIFNETKIHYLSTDDEKSFLEMDETARVIKKRENDEVYQKWITNQKEQHGIVEKPEPEQLSEQDAAPFRRDQPDEVKDKE